MHNKRETHALIKSRDLAHGSHWPPHKHEPLTPPFRVPCIVYRPSGVLLPKCIGIQLCIDDVWSPVVLWTTIWGTPVGKDGDLLLAYMRGFFQQKKWILLLHLT